MEFKAYIEAVEKVPDLGEKQYADRTFFAAVPACLFREYSSMYVKHASTIVGLTEILVYLVGGNPTLARMLLQWLKCADDDDMPLTSYVFDSASVTLKHQGSDANEHVTVNTRECMEYLIELADAKEMLSDALVSVRKDLWWKMAFANEEVDLFDIYVFSL